MKLPQAAYLEIRRHGEQTYPDESCGVLLGTSSSAPHEAREAIRCRNVHATPRTNYEIDLREVVGLQREARERGLEIVGFYHSHPDHAAQPSPTDLEQALWIGYSYLITSVEQGKATQTRSFLLTGTMDRDKALVEETVEVS